VIRLFSAATITLHQFTQVELIHNIDYEAGQVLLRQPVLQRGGNRYAVSRLIGWNLPDMVTSVSSWYDLTILYKYGR
jgi:hypothetical protein